MAIQNEAWFIHAVSDNVTHLAQSKRHKSLGTMRVKEGVVGKTWPFNRIGSLDMIDLNVRDADTSYLNPPQTKRRAVLGDFGAAVLIDEFDQVRTLTSPQSEFALMLAFARNRKLDNLAIGKTGLLAGGGDGLVDGGIIGRATTVDEAGETTSLSVLPAAQHIVNGGTNLTFTKIKDTAEKFASNNFDEEENYFFYSPLAMRKMLNDDKIISSDFGTIQALMRGGFPLDQSWMGFKWRSSTLLPKAGDVRSCIAFSKLAVGLATSAVKELKVSEAPHKWDNMQVVAKLSGGVVRIDDLGVVQVDCDETDVA